MQTIKKLDKAILSNNVRDLLYKTDLTKEQLADELDVSPRVIYCWQNGTKIPGLENIYALSQLFNVPMESILL